jgi:hypothetical protein
MLTLINQLRLLLASDIESETNYVTILNNIFLAFEPDFAGGLKGLLVTKLPEIVKAEGLSPYESAFYVRVHLARRIKRNGASPYWPGPQFIRDNRQKANQP